MSNALRNHTAHNSGTRAQVAALPMPTPKIARALMAGAVALALAATPATALADRRPSDRIGAKAISETKYSPKVAPDFNARAGIVMTDDGQVLWSRASSTPRAMASTTKLMTALLAIEKGGLGKTATVSKRAASTPYGLGLKPGQKVKVRKLLEMTLVASSNDAAYALGEHVSGSMPKFVARMNARAGELGLKNTQFRNPHGLDAPGHYSTPADLAVIASKLDANKEFLRIAKMRGTSMAGAKRQLKATNKLLGAYRGITGAKTGYTNDAGFSFVGTAKRGDVGLVTVVLGSSSNAARFGETKKLMDFGFRHVKRAQIAKAGDWVKSIPVEGSDRTVGVRLKAGASAELFALGGKVRKVPELPTELTLPVRKGQRLGEVRLMQGDRVLATVPAIATESIASLDEKVGEVPVADYVDRAIEVRTAESTEVPRFELAKEMKREVVLEPKLTAPVAKGQRVGEVRYVQDGKVVLSVPAVAVEDVEKPGVIDQIGISLTRSLNGLFNRA